MIQFKLMERRDMSADWSDCGIYANVDDAITAGDLLHFAISLIDRIARSAAPELEAEAQSKGRGRLGRAWTSPKSKGLYFSFVLRPSLPLNQLAQLTLNFWKKNSNQFLCKMIL